MTDSNFLVGRNVIVTGGSGGIGRVICLRLAELGANVIVHYYCARDRAEQVIEEINRSGSSAHAVAADLAEEPDRQLLFTEAHKRFGKVDILINNAAIQPVIDFDDISAADLDAILKTNIAAPFGLTQRFAAQLPDKRGELASIVNIASIEGSYPAVGHSHYAVSKSAIIMLTRSSALELGKKGIRVNSISPGLIDRPGLAEQWQDGVDRWHNSAPLHRLGRPEDIANAVAFLVSPNAGWISGHNLVVDGGMSICPGW